MIYLYDNAIVEDLSRSFNPDHSSDPIVKVVGPDHIIDTIAQLKEDKISLPIVALSRSESYKVDKSRLNFTYSHTGTPASLDAESNTIYYERVVPVDLRYSLSILTSSTADMDELVREILFKYLSMYFLSITLPYECKRDIRFGVVADAENIVSRSGVSEYLSEGKLYETVIPLNCQGCVLVTYSGSKLLNIDTIHGIEII